MNKTKVVWTTQRYQAVFKSEPLSHDALVQPGEYFLEHDKRQHQNAQHVGDFFGKSLESNLGSNQANLEWYDGQKEPINTVNMCRCAKPGEQVVGKDPETGLKVCAQPIQYSKDGVTLWVQVEKKGKQKQLKKTKVATRTSRRAKVATRTTRLVQTAKSPKKSAKSPKKSAKAQAPQQKTKVTSPQQKSKANAKAKSKSPRQRAPKKPGNDC